MCPQKAHPDGRDSPHMAIALLMLPLWILLSHNLANPCFIFMPAPAI
jgi:hypothetical protein